MIAYKQTQTDRQTDTLITVLRFPVGGGLIVVVVVVTTQCSHDTTGRTTSCVVRTNIVLLDQPVVKPSWYIYAI